MTYFLSARSQMDRSSDVWKGEVGGGPPRGLGVEVDVARLNERSDGLEHGGG